MQEGFATTNVGGFFCAVLSFSGGYCFDVFLPNAANPQLETVISKLSHRIHGC